MFIKNLSPQLEVYFQAEVPISSLFLSSTFFIVLSLYGSKRRPLMTSIREMAAVFPMAIFISLGMSYHNSMAIFQGVIGKKTAFVRTPNS